MKRFIWLAALLAATGAATGAAAAVRPPAVGARVAPDSIGIGDRFCLSIEVEKDQVQTVVFPEFSGDGSDGIELVESLPVDTLERRGRLVRLRKRYVLAAFEEGDFALGRARVLYADKNVVDTLRSDDSLFLHVATFAIDSASRSIYDVKPQKHLPFRLAEIRGYLVWGAAALVLLAAVAWGVLRLLSRSGRSVRTLFRPAPPVPPHVAAIRALEALHHRKLWQNNQHKLYYSGLSDIVRTYIAARFGIGAMEMTSDEILTLLRRGELVPPKSATDLAEVLRDADLVKFAKAVPDGERNEADYLKIYYFVEETKRVAEEDAGDPEIDGNHA